jgi:hypothetical protein
MELVAVHCRKCACFYLENVVVVVAGNTLCECGGIARVLSPQVYTPADESLFDAIVTSLDLAGVSWMTATELSKKLEARDLRAPGEALRELTRLVPGLSIIELIATDTPLRARRAEAMFESILDGIATTRSHSGIAPRFSAAAPSRKAGR